MAMFENEGFCPNNSFLHYVMEKQEVPGNWEHTRKLLGDRIGYMLYTKAGCTWHGWCYVVDCLVGATSTLGIEVAARLQMLIPECKYAKTGRKILVTDVINPYQIPGICRKGYEGFASSSDKVVILEDERYIVGITDEGETVHLYFFKKEEK